MTLEDFALLLTQLRRTAGRGGVLKKVFCVLKAGNGVVIFFLKDGSRQWLPPGGDWKAHFWLFQNQLHTSDSLRGGGDAV